MKVAILQSNYIPWKGYFDIIGKVDLFVFHDDVQYTKLDWRNRNKIKTAKGTQWLTVPCGTDTNRLICDVKIPKADWQVKHLNLIKENYKSTQYFNQYNNFLEEFYLSQKWTNLSDMNQYMIKEISLRFLGIKTQFKDSRSYNLKKKKEDRVIELLKKVGASTYLSGPSARSYLNENNFAKENITLEWMDYNNYLEYPQLFSPFNHEVSILDLLFNTGKNYFQYMLYNKGISENL